MGPGRGGGGASGAPRENAGQGRPRMWREKFISLFNLSLIDSFSVPRILDKGGGDSAVLAFRDKAVLFINLRARLVPFAALSQGLCIRSLNSPLQTGKEKGYKEFRLLKAPETMWNPSRELAAVFPCPPRPRALPRTSPRPRQPRSLSPGRAPWQVRPSPSRPLIGAQVGQSPPRAYVRCALSRPTSPLNFAAFGWRSPASPQSQPGAALGEAAPGEPREGGGRLGRRHRTEENQRRRR